MLRPARVCTTTAYVPALTITRVPRGTRVKSMMAPHSHRFVTEPPIPVTAEAQWAARISPQPRTTAVTSPHTEHTRLPDVRATGVTPKAPRRLRASHAMTRPGMQADTWPARFTTALQVTWSGEFATVLTVAGRRGTLRLLLEHLAPIKCEGAG
jgi:hypothetical protein